MENELINHFNVNLFVKTVNTALDPSAPDHRQAEQSLVQFKAAPNSWLHINSILSETNDNKAHFIAMQLLEHIVKTRWNTFTDEHKESFKNYIIQQILHRSKEQNKNEILEKFNIILVEILKRDWPIKWPRFIPDIINASQTSGMDVCTNSLLILKRLNDEVFIFTDVTTVRKRLLERQLKEEFIHIFKLINNILEWSKTSETSKNLLNATFDTFESFCDLIPLYFFCETNIIENIFFYINRGFAVNVMKCLVKIVNKSNEATNSQSQLTEEPNLMIQFENKILCLHNELILFLERTYNEYAKVKINEVYCVMSIEEKEFIAMTVMLLCAFYDNYRKYEVQNLANLKSGMRLIIKISDVDDENISYTIINFWVKFTKTLYDTCACNQKVTSYEAEHRTTLHNKYESVLKGMVEALLHKMPRPEEVYVTENEYGEIVREKITETKDIQYYQNVKQTFFYLSYLNRDFTLELIKSKTVSLYDSEKFSYDFLNRISWSAGCMAGALDPRTESDFFIYILKELLTLCESKYTKDDKAVIASNIMFLISSFDRFLLDNHRFLKTVVKKLCEFMDENHEGIKDMACDTFLKISEKCARIFVTQMEGNELYIMTLCKNLQYVTKSLEFYQRRIVYESLCNIFASLNDYEQLPYVELLVSCFNFDIYKYSTKESLNACCHFLRSYEIIFSKLPDNINHSKLLFEHLCIFLEENIHVKTKNAKLVNDEILRLLISVVRQYQNANRSQDIINRIYKSVLDKFYESRNPLYLILAAEIVKSVKTDNLVGRDSFMVRHMVQYVSELSNDDDELRTGYLTLIDVLLADSFDISFAYLIESLDLLDISLSVVFNGLTTDQTSNELSLHILENLVTKTYEKRLFTFYQRYALQVIENIIGLLVDRDQSYSFDKQCTVLSKIIVNIKSNNMIRLDDTTDNVNYVSGYIYKLLSNAFCNLTKESMELFIVGLFSLASNCDILKEHVSDFRIKIYEFYSNEDINDEIELKRERESRIVN